MAGYFSNFPTITYNGYQALDITKNIRLDATYFNDPFAFKTYSINNQERPDQLSNKFYNDPSYEWLIYLSNQQVDSYQWYLDYNAFYDYLNQKYGDYTLAEQKVKYYLNSWYDNKYNPISVAAYEALDPSLTKYYVPEYDSSGNVTQYVRRQVDWIYRTNQIVKLYFTFNISNTFINDEIINIKYDTNVTGNGQIAFFNSNSLYFQHTSGNSVPINNTINVSAFSLYSQQSNNTITITNTNQIIVESVNVIPTVEQIYYEPYTYFDYENELNENNKNIIYLNPGYLTQITREYQNIFANG